MIASIHQPGYWPWLGLLDKIAKSELYVVLDDVVASRRANQFRNTFLVGGAEKHLTLPTDYERGALISSLRFRDEDWRTDHLTKLRAYYRKAPNFGDVFARIEVLYAEPHDYVVPFLLATMRFAMAYLGVEVPQMLSSELGHEGQKGYLMLDLCKRAGADSYLSGRGAFEYMQQALPAFERAGVPVEWHNFSHPTYPQFPSSTFVSGLACLDLFFFMKEQEARELFWDNVQRTRGERS